MSSLEPIRNRHPYKMVQCGKAEFAIDVDLIPFVQALWALGINTINSCQDSPRFSHAQPGMQYAWIQFAFAKDAEEFIACVIPANFSDATVRLHGGYGDDIYQDIHEIGAWTAHPHINPLGEGVCRVILSPAFRLKHYLLGEYTRRLRVTKMTRESKEGFRKSSGSSVAETFWRE